MVDKNMNDNEIVNKIDNCKEKCEHAWYMDDSVVCTSYPPQYRWVCSKCGAVRYSASKTWPFVDEPHEHVWVRHAGISSSDINNVEHYAICELCGIPKAKENEYDELINGRPAEEYHPVYRPEYYASGNLECIDWIEAELTPEEFRGYLKGTVMKYLWRHENKENPVMDLGKAGWYINKLKEHFEKLQNEEKKC